MMRKLSTAALALTGLLGLAGAAAADGPAAGPCPGGCAEKVCRPIVETKIVVKPCYTSICEPFCEVRCSPLGLLAGGCCGGDGDAHHQCTHVKTRKILVVKLKPETQCVNKCVVEVAPPCAAPAPHHLMPPMRRSYMGTPPAELPPVTR
jgi:hypothetical protein